MIEVILILMFWASIVVDLVAKTAADSTRISIVFSQAGLEACPDVFMVCQFLI